MDEKLHRTIPVVLLPYNIPMPSYDLAEVTPGVEYTLTVLGQPLSILDTDADPENDGEYHFSTVIQAFIASIVQ